VKSTKHFARSWASGNGRAGDASVGRLPEAMELGSPGGRRRSSNERRAVNGSGRAADLREGKGNDSACARATHSPPETVVAARGIRRDPATDLDLLVDPVTGLDLESLVAMHNQESGQAGH
jgi:hypothetical protein